MLSGSFSDAARGVADQQQAHIDDAGSVGEGEQHAVHLHVVRLLLQSRGGARVGCLFLVLRCRMPATACESREENYILRCRSFAVGMSGFKQKQ